MLMATLAACSSGTPTPTAVQGDGSVAAAEQGRRLSDADARDLEQHLGTDASDIQAREKLVGYYFLTELRSPVANQASPGPSPARAARDRHLLWLINNQPQLQLLGTAPDGVVEPVPDAAAYDAAAAAWTRQSAVHSTGAQVLGNAGIFYAQANGAQAEALLKRAQALDAGNVTWPAKLGDYYYARALTGTSGLTAWRSWRSLLATMPPPPTLPPACCAPFPSTPARALLPTAAPSTMATWSSVGWRCGTAV
jgi:hypothetical protein